MKSPFVEVNLKKTKQTSEKSKNSYFNIENPYHAYDIESGEWFYHENLINKIRSIFEGKNAPKMIIVQGQKGSGKTSTLCKLEANPDLLGSKFRTTYIDYKERKSADKDAYLSYIYYSILKRLKKYEMVIDFTDYFACQKIALPDLTSFIQKIECTLPTDTQLLIIFDEFDTFLRKANISITDEIISFIKYILEKTSKVRLLLAGERQISGVARKANVHNLFDIAISINI
ncbi:AAA family ATPase, partial [candidate division KSB1 bacterium]|nr:AAA family ATPase [candidate division KSB1 bacterium]